MNFKGSVATDKDSTPVDLKDWVIARVLEDRAESAPPPSPAPAAEPDAEQ